MTQTLDEIRRHGLEALRSRLGHCGEAVFSRETTELIRQTVCGAGHPVKTVPMDVFAMS